MGVQKIFCNGIEVKTVYCNGTLIWSAPVTIEWVSENVYDYKRDDGGYSYTIYEYVKLSAPLPLPLTVEYTGESSDEIEVTKTLAAGATVSERFATGGAWHDSWESGGDHDSSKDYRLESILYGGTRYTINYRSPVTISLGGGQVVCNGT